MAMMMAMGGGSLTGLNYAAAQAVIFPQQAQAGNARLQNNEGTYTLANDLLSAQFKVADGKLKFNGCEALGLKPGSDLFTVTLGNGTSFSSADMTMSDVKELSLTSDSKAARGSEKIPGQAIEATFTKDGLTVVWRAVLRDGSHYLRTELELSSPTAVAMSRIAPMNYGINTNAVGIPKTVGNTRGSLLMTEKIFAGLETPMGINSVVSKSSVDSDFTLNSWNENSFNWLPAEIPSAITALGFSTSEIAATGGYAKFANAGETTVTFKYSSGTHRLNIVGVDVVDMNGNVVAQDYHIGFTGGAHSNNTYTLNIPEAGIYMIRYFMETKTETITASGNITFNNTVTTPSDAEIAAISGAGDVAIQGVWERPTSLQPGKTWKVSSVVGLVAPGQARRSFLSYSERERAVPWRSFPIYNSWYELNIDRNNDPNYTSNMNISQCVNVANQWKANLFDKHNANIQALVWDDGWDSYGTWTFNPNFPNGFSEVDAVAKSMQTGIGAWLGPVGGYGQSGTYRRNYWTNKGGMGLGNPEYYKVFLDACSNMTTSYDFRFFKFDGISAQFSSVGPDSGNTGIENAEGIIQLEQDVREIKPDIFLNTTVGTWASPFWFRYTDAVWRQEADWSAVSAKGLQASCNDRERWITYRDRLVYQNFVSRSPICPINTLMTHGFILTRFGDVSKNMSYQSILNELRCAFACGSGMIELYADYSLLNKAYTDGNGQEGQLWGEVAKMIKWHEKNADILPDIHWVGGNPYNESTGNGEVYGWAAWNGKKAVLTLRNPNGQPTLFKGTLRQALEIPEYETQAIKLTKSFDDQAELNGLPSGEAIGLDTEIKVTIPANGVFIFEGVHTSETPAAPLPELIPIDPVEPEESATYPIAFPADENHTNSGRLLNSVSMNAVGQTGASVAVGSTVMYKADLEAEVPAKPGQQIQPALSYSGSWMHNYWYVDYDQDGQFNSTLNADGTTGGELVSYSYLDGTNSLGQSAEPSVAVESCQPFHLPADIKPGIYRCRMKIDWNDANPEGRSESNASGNYTKNNGGYIVDFLLHVYADKPAVLAVLPEGTSALTTSKGEKITANPTEVTRSETLTINSKTPEGKKINRMVIRMGYNLDSESYKINGNPQWREYEVPLRDNGTFNIPFDKMDRPAVIFATVESSSAVEEIAIDLSKTTLYNLQGAKVNNPGPGIYVTAKGKKVIIRK